MKHKQKKSNEDPVVDQWKVVAWIGLGRENFQQREPKNENSHVMIQSNCVKCFK